MELSPTYSESPPDGSVAAACCDFTTCCYSGLCAVLCFTGVAITFIFSSAPDQDAGLGVATPQTWLLGPVLILLSVLVAVKTLMHVRKQPSSSRAWSCRCRRADTTCRPPTRR